MNMAEIKILVIADKDSFITQIRPHLIGLGYPTPLLASSGAQAVQMAADVLPDLVLIDIIQRETEGIEAAQQLQELFGVPVIFLTDHPHSDTLKQARLTQPFDYILKPLNPRVVNLTIELVLYKKKLQANEQKLAITHQAESEQREFVKAWPEVDSTRLLEAEREQRELAEALREVGAVLSATLDFNTILDRLLDQVGLVVPYDTGNVFLVEEGLARIVRTRGLEQFGPEIAQAAVTFSFDIATTPNLRQMAESKEPLVIPDTSMDPGWLQGQGWAHVRSWAGAPIMAQGQVIAFFSLDKTQPNFYQAKHAERLAIFASQAALALENARLYEAEARRRREAETLREAAAALTSALDLEQVLDNILTYLEQVIPYDSASVFLLEGNCLRVVAGRGLPFLEEVIGQDFPAEADDPFLDKMRRTQQPLCLADAQTESHFKQWGNTDYIRGWMAVPLVIRERIIGYVTLDSRQVAAYGPPEVDLAQAFANQAAMAIENARLFSETRQRAEQLEALRQVLQDLTALRDLDTLLHQIVERAIQLLNGEGGSVYLYRPERQVLELVMGLGQRVGPVGTFLNLGEGLTGKVWDTGKPLIIDDYQKWPDKALAWANLSALTVIGVPIRWGDEALGVLNILADNTKRRFTSEDADLLAQFATQAAIAIQNAHLYQAERTRYHEAEAMRQAALALTSTIAMDQVLERILVELQRVVPYDSASVQLIKGNSLEIIGGHGFPNLAELLGISFPIQGNDNPNILVLQSREPIIIDDVKSVGYLGFNEEPHAAANIRGWMGVPLLIGDRNIGMLALDKQIPNFYTETHARTAMSYAAQAAIAIENARLYAQAQRHAAELEMRVSERTFELEVLYQLTQALGQATQLSDIVRLILLHLYQAIPHDVAASLLVTDSVSTLVIQSQRSISAQLEDDIQEIMCTILNQTSTKTIDLRRIQPKTETIIRVPLKDLASIMQVPIVIDETPVGLLLVATEQPNQFSQEQVRLLRTVADQAAESIQRVQLLLAAEYQRLESLVAHLPDGIVLLSAERRIVLTNPTAQKFLNALTPVTTGDQLNYLGDQPIETIIDPNSIGLPKEVESTNYPRQVFEIVAKPMAAGPEAGGWTLVIRDVTTERATQERIQQQDRLVAVGQLAAGIAHDFNNILTSMIGFAELARTYPGIPAIVGEDLQRIVQQGQRAAVLIRQILDFSRQSITEKRPIEFAPFLKETVKLLERTIPENIRIILEIEPNNPKMYTLNADPAQIQQVLTNLAVNARDAMPNGGIMRIRLAGLTLQPGERPPYPEMTPGHWLIVSISDTGAGIAPETLPRIFEPFFTTKEVGKGTGLGLAQVYGIVTQHDGYIDVRTEFGKSTTFTVYLPTALPMQKILPQTAETETTHGHGEVILLVEDDLPVLEVTQAMLEHLGYSVITATNGRQALEVYDQHQDQIALVLTDITMPEMGGVALAQNLRAKYPAIKIIVLTGYPLEGEAKELLDQGVIDWLQKPLNRRELAQTISRSLNQETRNAVRSEGG